MDTFGIKPLDSDLTPWVQAGMVGGTREHISLTLGVPRTMAPLYRILVLCVGFLTTANAGESGVLSPHPPQPQGRQGVREALQENQVGDSNLNESVGVPGNWGFHMGPTHKLVFGVEEWMQAQAKVDGGMEAHFPQMTESLTTRGKTGFGGS